MQLTQVDQVIALFTAEQSKIMVDLSNSDDKKESKDLHKKLRAVTGVINNLLSFKSLINTD
jgi:hypothetical protein